MAVNTDARTAENCPRRAKTVEQEDLREEMAVCGVWLYL